MTLFDPDPKLRWLFCLTHPDDEIAICAWIHRLTQAGAEVHLAWTHSIAVREAEARRAAGALGVPAERLRFLEAPDRHVAANLPELIPVFRQMMAEVKPDRVCCGAFEQGHIDHDATNLLVNRTFGGPVLETPLYHPYSRRLQRLNRFADPEGEQVLHLTEEERRLKKRVARMYPSQRIWRILVGYEVLQIARMRAAELAHTERLRLQTHKDFLKPNLPPELARQVVRTQAWRRWVECVEAVKA